MRSQLKINLELALMELVVQRSATSTGSRYGSGSSSSCSPSVSFVLLLLLYCRCKGYQGRRDVLTKVRHISGCCSSKRVSRMLVLSKHTHAHTLSHPHSTYTLHMHLSVHSGQLQKHLNRALDWRSRSEAC